MDVLTPSQRHKAMSHVRSENTSIELILRKALWHRGYRYRKNYKALPGSPDIAITKYRIAIFCDSEFFHGKDWEELKLRLENGDNSTYWIKKIMRNMERDRENEQSLRYQDWTVLRFWGHDIVKHTDECIKAIEETIYLRSILNSKDSDIS
ncbi:MAG: very short patch repair endonuclease [Lachnospiraceae bacterium]|nr:very short patch repair endonuclease [Lachnospiraceae bacterium]